MTPSAPLGDTRREWKRAPRWWRDALFSFYALVGRSGGDGGKHHIETVWGRGYVLRDPQEGVVAA